MSLGKSECFVSGQYSICPLGMAELEASAMVSDVIILMFSKVVIAKVKKKTIWTDKAKSARRKGLMIRTKSRDL